MADLTTIILTYNEELNITDCIKSVEKISKRIIVIDSFSTDNTVKIAEAIGVEVYQNRWINYSKQYQFGIGIANITTKWIFRLDADEQLTNKSAKEVEKLCTENGNTDVNGIVVRFKVNFLGRDLRYGGIYPFRKLLIYKNGYGHIENRNMDEHIVLTEGKTIELKNDSLHYDFKNLDFWIDKHNKYSSREVLDYYDSQNSSEYSFKLDENARIKRFIKYNLYYKLPIGIRPLIYFLYRYIIKLGFLDGKEGMIFAVLQAFWYRFLVDAKIVEYENSQNVEGVDKE